MKCILMNKNTEVVVAEYDTILNGFSEVYEIREIAFAPLIIAKQYASDPDNLPANLSKWFRGRGIPKWRDQLDLLLARLGVQSPEELLDKSFGLSLADQCWLKPYDADITYDDINFFDHDFDAADFVDASFSDSISSKPHDVALQTPNNTTDGMLKKSWVIEGSERYLLKSGYKGDTLQPFNEVLATMISRRLGFRHIPYTLDTIKGKIVSKCKCFTTKDTEIIPAYQVLFGHEQHSGFLDYETYIHLLEENGITDARSQVEDMFVLDYIIMNEDRHLNNFGIIRDVNTLKWLNTTPIFDNGQALNVLSYGDGEIAISGEGRFFYDTEKFDKILEVVQDFRRFDFAKLDGVVEDFRSLLLAHLEAANFTSARVDALCSVLSSQISKIKLK